MTEEAIEGIISAWTNGKSALLYGPPATGKTRVLSQLFGLLDASPETASIALNTRDSRNPFQSTPEAASLSALDLPRPVKKIWLTFHQSMSYEDFVIGLAPDNGPDGAVQLVPTAGALLDAIAELQSEDGAKSVVIFIDEINRGNAARIFGEFLTFLDFDYRDVRADGSENPLRLPLPLRHLKHDTGGYEDLRLHDGSLFQLNYPSYFPRHIYVVASMNSVDRTAIPIDSALARRFSRIEMRPDLRLLLDEWGIDRGALADKATTPDQLSAWESAALIMDRVNLFIAENFGPDFELGHGLFLGAGLAEQDFEALAAIWDTSLYPQIEDRFSGRLEELAALLRVDEFAGPDYAWGYRESVARGTSASVLAPATLSGLSPIAAKYSLQRLGGKQAIA